MAEIVELIAADHLHIMRWQVRLAELRHRPGEPGDALPLAAIWDTLASLIDLHMAADEEVCGPAIYGSGPAGLELFREVGGAHEGIREIIRETGRYPAGSPRWWNLATATLAAWTRCLHREVYGPLADCRRRLSPALRAQLARQWRAYMDTQIRGRYQDPPPLVPTCRLRQTRTAAMVPRLADPAFAPLACVCPACTRELDPLRFAEPPRLAALALAREEGGHGSARAGRG